MSVKGEYVDGYEIYAKFTLPLTFRTRFCTTTAISDAANIKGEYCALANFNSANYGSVISKVSTFIMTIGI